MYLIDPAVAALQPAQAIWLAVGFLVAGWIAYDLLCRLVGFRDLVLGVLVGLLVLAMSYVATHLFAGRAAFLLVGAAMATIMSANVFFVIIPGQKRMVAALARGETPDPLPGQRGKQRSVHNTYFTLPVVFAMLSTHYASAFAHPHSWLVLAVFMAAAALIRQFFVLWHSGARTWWLLALAGALLAVAFAMMAPREAVAMPEVAVDHGTPPLPTGSSSPNDGLAAAAQTAVDTAAIQPLIRQHCAVCHSARPSLMASAPLGTMFDTPEQIEANAQKIHQQAVVLKAMPLGNITRMSEDERALIGRWFEARAAQTP